MPRLIRFHDRFRRVTAGLGAPSVHVLLQNYRIRDAKERCTFRLYYNTTYCRHDRHTTTTRQPRAGPGGRARAARAAQRGRTAVRGQRPRPPRAARPPAAVRPGPLSLSGPGNPRAAAGAPPHTHPYTATRPRAGSVARSMRRGSGSHQTSRPRAGIAPLHEPRHARLSNTCRDPTYNERGAHHARACHMLLDVLTRIQRNGRTPTAHHAGLDRTAGMRVPWKSGVPPSVKKATCQPPAILRCARSPCATKAVALMPQHVVRVRVVVSTRPPWDIARAFAADRGWSWGGIVHAFTADRG